MQNVKGALMKLSFEIRIKKVLHSTIIFQLVFALGITMQWPEKFTIHYNSFEGNTHVEKVCSSDTKRNNNRGTQKQ